MIRKILAFGMTLLMVSCGLINREEDPLDITSKFNTTWNVRERFEVNDDGSITYKSVPYGGLVGWVNEHNMPVDWSDYECVKFEFAEPTTTHTQVMISNKVKCSGRPGITSLTCSFDGQDVHQVEKVVFQTADSVTVTVKSVRLTPASGSWEAQPLWEGSCEFGNWEQGITLSADQFNTAVEGDKLEFEFDTDISDPGRQYWQFKTIYNDGTNETLEGNAGVLSEWGTANVARDARLFRILLTANDVKRLKKSGVYVTGYYCNVAKCNLLYPSSKTEQ